MTAAPATSVASAGGGSRLVVLLVGVVSLPGLPALSRLRRGGTDGDSRATPTASLSNAPSWLLTAESVGVEVDPELVLGRGWDTAAVRAREAEGSTIDASDGMGLRRTVEASADPVGLRGGRGFGGDAGLAGAQASAVSTS